MQDQLDGVLGENEGYVPQFDVRVLIHTHLIIQLFNIFDSNS